MTASHTIYKNKKNISNIVAIPIIVLSQVESQGQHILSHQPNSPQGKEGGVFSQQSPWSDIIDTESSEKMQKVLDSTVDQIAGVR